MAEASRPGVVELQADTVEVPAAAIPRRKDGDGPEGSPWRTAAPYSGRRLSARARDELVVRNIPFVVQMASDFRDSGALFEDLLGEGVIGLMEAARRFDPSRGHTFLTYAVWWIRKAMLNVIHRAPMIPVPKYRRAQIQRIREAEFALSQKLQRPPTLLEISDQLRYPAERLHRALTVRVQEVSLDQPIRAGEGLSLGEAVPDGVTDNPGGRLLRRESHRAVRDALSKLSPLEDRILRWRFGVHGGPPRTLQEIGNEVGLSRERVRQIEMAARRRMRRRLEC